MKKFLLKLAIYFFGLSIIISPLLFCKIGGKSLKYIDNPTALIIEKTKRLESLTSPKIVIIGGSSAFFGMNSEIVENRLSKPVVNMAQFGGFGLDFILKQTENDINQGDIVFLCSEYYLGEGINKKTAEQILRYHPVSSKNLSGENITFFSKLRNNFYNNVESIFNFVLIPISRKSPIYKYSRVANKYGDNTGYLKYKSDPNKLEIEKREYTYYEGITTIKEYIDKVNTKGGEVYIVFQPISRSSYSQNKDVFEKYYNDYTEIFKDKVLCSPKEMVFEDDQFFDTENHLNGNARDERSNRTVEFYNRAMSDE